MQKGDYCSLKYTVLVVDNDIHTLSFFKRTLRKDFEVITTTDPQEAIDIIRRQENEIAIIICDQLIPKMSGVEILKIVKNYAPEVVRIMVTGLVDTDVLVDCINECEAYCYITKPCDPHELLQTLGQSLLFRERTIEKNNIVSKLRELLFSTVRAICETLDEKDKYTTGHSRRVTIYSLLLAQELGLSDAQLEKLQFAGLLHDIGKIGTPEHILNKPGKLTDAEYDLIKKHPGKGADIIMNLKKLGEVVDWVRCHHERYDGKGYPQNLSGEDIPFGAAILAVADAYDAMTSHRSYRNGLPHDVAVEEIRKCMGSQFNPDVAEAFLRIERKFEKIMQNKDNGKEYTICNLLIESKNLSKMICH